jgi:F-type H+-transporting ATPase subunit a
VRRGTIILVAALFVALLLIGFLSLRSPRPIVELRAETILEIGPFPLTNTVLTAWIAIVLMAIVTYFGFRNVQLIPRGLQNFLEMAMEAFYNMVVGTAGEANGRRFFPVVATIFFYVVFANWLGLFPGVATIGKVQELHVEEGEEFHEQGFVFQETGGVNVIMPSLPGWPPAEPSTIDVQVEEGATLEEKEEALEEATAELKEDEKAGFFVPFFRSVNTDINAPLALAIMSAIFVEFWGISSRGFFRYASKFFNFGRLLRGKLLDGIIDVFVGLLELVAEAARILSFTFRLFGNILAGEILFLVVIFLLPLIALQFVYVMELFVGLIQAFIFAMLTLVFGIVAVSGHGDEGEVESAGPTTPE